jgi:serine O-acetyltransferase
MEEEESKTQTQKKTKLEKKDPEPLVSLSDPAPVSSPGMVETVESETIRGVVWQLLRSQSHDICTREPLLEPLIVEVILRHSSFKEALIHRLAQKFGGEILQTNFYLNILKQCLATDTEGVVERLAMEDLIAVEERDPACLSIAQAFLYFKGYNSLQAYRCSHVLWVNNRPDLALLIQSRSTEIFGVDIHPAAIIGSGLMIDHGTGVVIGETTVIGKNCSFLHGITLGGTGKSESRDRHPKIGDNVFLGCNVSVLGNIRIGDHSRVGSGSLVLTSLPPGSTAVGSPAIIKSINPPNISETETFDPTVPLEDQREAIVEFDSDSRPSIKLWSKIWYPKSWSSHPIEHRSIRECFEYSWSDYKI